MQGKSACGEAVPGSMLASCLESRCGRAWSARLLLVPGTVLHGPGFERPLTAPASALVEATLLTGRVSGQEAPWPRGAEAAAPPAGP